MRIPQFYTNTNTDTEPVGVGRTSLDIALVLLLTVALIAIAAHGPSHTYSYAQFWQIRASIDHLNGGSLILPKIDAAGEPARKPQLYAWILTTAMKWTGLNNDFIYRMPTMLAAMGTAVLVYLLGRRWYSRRAGLLSAILFVTTVKMNKLVFLATTDMLLMWWITWCVFCVDRLLFHPCPPKPRVVWLVGFWVGMILAMITKGWGIVNLAIVGGFVTFAVTFGPGFQDVQSHRWRTLPMVLLRRWGAAFSATQLLWGLLAMTLVAVPLWIGMLHVGGEAFRETVYYEVWQRLSGEGAHAPGSTTGPAVGHLYYNLLPASIFAGCAFFLVTFRLWLNYRSPIALPLYWIITVLIAFGIPAGFRPDYLAPCYPAVGLLAGWAVVELSRSERWSAGASKHLRRICQAVPFVIAAGLIVIPLLYLLHGRIAALSKIIAMPTRVSTSTWWMLGVLPALGLGVCGVGVLAVRKCRLGWTVAATAIGMLGILFLNCHFFTRHARTGDGETMIRFAEIAKPVLGEDSFRTYCAIKLGTETYVGRFGGEYKQSPSDFLQCLNKDSDVKWLLISDVGLINAGAYRIDSNGPFTLKKDGVKHRFRPRPQDFGVIRARSDMPIQFENWGRMYLIELQRPIMPESEPFLTGYISDPVE